VVLACAPGGARGRNACAAALAARAAAFPLGEAFYPVEARALALRGDAGGADSAAAFAAAFRNSFARLDVLLLAPSGIEPATGEPGAWAAGSTALVRELAGSFAMASQAGPGLPRVVVVVGPWQWARALLGARLARAAGGWLARRGELAGGDAEERLAWAAALPRLARGLWGAGAAPAVEVCTVGVGFIDEGAGASAGAGAWGALAVLRGLALRSPRIAARVAVHPAVAGLAPRTGGERARWFDAQGREGELRPASEEQGA